MKRAELEEAIEAARKFLEAAELLKAEERGAYYTGSPRSSAVRRRSMDLTRALARLRNAR